MVVCCKGGGINVYIICIVTLFLAEYCGFGWVVGTFVWIFWFCFRNRLKMLYFHFLKVRLKICRGIRGGRRPTTTPGKFSSELLKNENITFSSDCENKIKIFRKKFQLLSQIHNIQPKIKSLYIWYTRLCHHHCHKPPCYIRI